MWKCDIEWQNKHTVSLSMNYTERLHVIAPCLSADYKQSFCAAVVSLKSTVYIIATSFVSLTLSDT